MSWQPPERVIVCGCRTLRDKHLVWRRLDRFTDNVVIVHGDQSSWDPEKRERYGADYFAKRWAERVRFATSEAHPAEWDLHGKKAGPLRNQEMADLGAHRCLAFWDGESRGTLDMIRRAVTKGIPVEIVPLAASSQSPPAREGGG